MASRRSAASKARVGGGAQFLMTVRFFPVASFTVVCACQGVYNSNKKGGKKSM